MGVGSRHETDTPDTPSPQPDTVGSVRALSQALEVNRCTIYEWLKLPGHPGGSQATGYDVAAWRTFARTIGTKTGAGQTDGKTALQEEELRLKNLRLRSKIAQENGGWTRNDDFIPRMAEVCNNIKSLLRSKLERELPALFDGDPARQKEMHHFGRATVDELCEHVGNLGDLLESPGEAEEDRCRVSACVDMAAGVQ